MPALVIAVIRNHLLPVEKLPQELEKEKFVPEPVVPVSVEGTPTDRQIGPHGGVGEPPVPSPPQKLLARMLKLTGKLSNGPTKKLIASFVELESSINENNVLKDSSEPLQLYLKGGVPETFTE